MHVFTEIVPLGFADFVFRCCRMWVYERTKLCCRL